MYEVLRFVWRASAIAGRLLIAVTGMPKVFCVVNWHLPLACLAALLSGCAVLPREVTFVRDNIRCDGLQDDPFSATKYSSIWVGTPREPYTGWPRVSLRFPDGKTVRSDQMEASWLRAHANRNAPRRASSWWVEQGWPTGSEEVAVAGYHFLVQADKVLAFGIALNLYQEEFRPEFGNAEGRVFVRPPFREHDLVTLFGPPDSVRKRVAGELL